MKASLRAKILWTLACLALTAVQAASARADDYCCVCFSETGCVNRGCDSLCGVVANEDECDAFCRTEECRDGTCQQYHAPCTHGAFCGSGQGLVCDDPTGVVQIPFCCDPTVPGSGCFRPGIATPVPTVTPAPTRTPVPAVGTPSSSGVGLAVIATLLVVIGLLMLVVRERP